MVSLTIPSQQEGRIHVSWPSTGPFHRTSRASILSHPKCSSSLRRFLYVFSSILQRPKWRKPISKLNHTSYFKTETVGFDIFSAPTDKAKLRRDLSAEALPRLPGLRGWGGYCLFALLPDGSAKFIKQPVWPHSSQLPLQVWCNTPHKLTN